jgi:hypothetical protein
MDDVEGMMGKMRLLEVEMGVRIGGGSRSKALEGSKEAQAVVKVLSEKYVPSRAIEQSLGKVWCPVQGIGCKDFGGEPLPGDFLSSIWKEKGDGGWTMDGGEGLEGFGDRGKF